MANVHNVFLRGLNSIYLQAPHVSDPTDVADLLLYTKAWADAVHHHHSHEEKILFPRIDALAKEAGVERTMEQNVDQHQLFEPRIGETMAWVEDVRQGKKEFESKVLLGLIDSFAPVLTKHLHEEIETLMGLEGLDGEKVKQAMTDTANEGIKTADTVCCVNSLLRFIVSLLIPGSQSLVVPQVFGCVDKSYPGSADFPPVPFILPWLNAYWFTRKHKGAWRFNPCDEWGRPRPLQFL
jgi:hemerythrin-like domain-containing protein